MSRANAVVATPKIIRTEQGFTDKIYIAGQSEEPALVDTTKDMAVLCITGNGSVCSGFGVQGWVLINFSDNGMEQYGSLIGDHGHPDGAESSRKQTRSIPSE